MGASAWRYFTPYKQNVQQALFELRQKEFQEGRYYKPGAYLPETFEEWMKQLDLPQEQEQLYKAAFDEMKAMSKQVPSSIEELFEQNQESGTHSILDIFSIDNTTDEDESGTISEDDLVRLFGTGKPNRQMVEEKADLLLDFRGRWFCTYIVVYKDGQPDELFFTGYSGD
jgi:hypothetical protein